MNFDLDEDQRALRDTVERFIAREYSFEQRLAYAREAGGWSGAAWQALAEIGLTALAIPERDGGLGGRPSDVLIVSEALGHGTVLEPFFSSAILSAAVLVRLEASPLRSELLAGIADGSRRVAFAHEEPEARTAQDRPCTRAFCNGSDWRLGGAKRLVLHGDSATDLLVSASIDGHPGTGVFHVRPEAAGLARKSYALLSGQRAVDAAFADAPAELLAVGDDAQEAIGHALCDGIAAACAEAVGTMTALHDLTVDYLKTRKQFGRNIGAFQALQHKAVDMLIAVEQARSMAMYAAMTHGEPLVDRRVSVSAAKVQLCESSRFVSRQAVQLHGGIGMTLEYRAGQYVRHLLVLEKLFGDKEFHLGRLAELGGIYRQ